MLYTMNAYGCRAVADSHGGELISYENNGVEYVWTGDDAWWAGHAPVLFPIVCALADSQIKIEGKTYSMNRHGFARGSDFSVAESGEDHIVFELKESRETLAQYPYAFTLRITHQILENGFTTRYEVQNTDNKPILFCIGGHAGFRCPLGAGENFEDYLLRFDQPEEAAPCLIDSDNLLQTGRTRDVLQGRDWPLRYGHFDEDVLVFHPVRSRRIDLLHQKSGKGFSFAFSGFSALGVWTPPHKKAPFLCLEPWAGVPAVAGESGNFEDKPYAVTLQEKESFQAGYTMTVL